MSRAAIFVYHDFVERPETAAPRTHTYVLDQTRFDAHLDALAAIDAQPMRLADVARRDVTTGDHGRFVLSFDDGHISNYTVAFARLAERRWPGCFFIVASRIGKPDALGWPELRAMAAAGMEIGSHSLTHPFLQHASDAEVRREFGESKRILEDGLGQAVTLASLPYGSTTPRVRAIVSELGYAAFCTSVPGLVGDATDALALPRIAIKQRTPARFLTRVVAGRGITLAGLRSAHAIKEVGKQLMGNERWRRVRRAVIQLVPREAGR
jgi:peptidoglycan/xylan/chitin deacetylase (PgdA/CDA1 family)